MPATVGIIEYGWVVLNDATLVVEGTVIPEPASLLLFGTGLIVILARDKQIVASVDATTASSIP